MPHRVKWFAAHHPELHRQSMRGSQHIAPSSHTSTRGSLMNHAERNRRNITTSHANPGAATVSDPDAPVVSYVPSNDIVRQPVSIRVNGTVRPLEVDTRATLLDTLREQLSLF